MRTSEGEPSIKLGTVTQPPSPCWGEPASYSWPCSPPRLVRGLLCPSCPTPGSWSWAPLGLASPPLLTPSWAVTPDLTNVSLRLYTNHMPGSVFCNIFLSLIKTVVNFHGRTIILLNHYYDIILRKYHDYVRTIIIIPPKLFLKKKRYCSVSMPQRMPPLKLQISTT